ncbi:hypothetical protein B0H12DRAFT_55102 [Mycena haematopus]|nr:hypothetical protein B0H12DRAFT_55102 [Mycena haematopus]
MIRFKCKASAPSCARERPRLQRNEDGSQRLPLYGWHDEANGQRMAKLFVDKAIDTPLTSSLTMRLPSPPPQQPFTIPLPPDLLDAVLPNTTHDERVKSFNDVLELEGSVDAAVALHTRVYECIKTGVVIGVRPVPPPHLTLVFFCATQIQCVQATYPPANAVIHTADVGPLRLFYHSLYPAHLRANNPFSWNLYIGRPGQGLESIMPDWEAQGIRVEVPNLLGRWERCGALTILPSTRVRITYPESDRDNEGKKFTVTEEVILPGDPKDARIHVRLLPPPPVDV